MASIEYLNKRIEGKRKEIEKLQKKLVRIEKAEATGWEVNPYFYSDHDKKWTIKDLEEARKALEKYEADLQTEQEKANSRNVEAILKFLENWKNHVREFYRSEFQEYKKELAEWYAYDKEYCEWSNNGGWKDQNKKEIQKEYREKRNAFQIRWNFIQPYIERKYNAESHRYEQVFNIAKLNKDLIQEANIKYDDIIERTNKITGKITDATALEVGEKGELNGYIIGERGTAKVNTIGAGGYNIQCYHFRTLVHAI